MAHSKEIEEFLFDLESPLEETRKKAILSLVKNAGPLALPYLNKLSESDPSPAIRYFAKQGIFLLKSKTIPEDTETQKSLESDEDIKKLLIGSFSEKVDILDFLEKNLSLKYYPAIKSALKSEDNEDLLIRLIRLITNFGIQSDVQYFRDFINHKSINVKKEIIASLGKIGTNQAYSILLSFLLDESEDIIDETLNVLKAFGLEQFRSLLENEVNSNDPISAEAAMIAAGYLKDQGVYLLETGLKHSDPKVRTRAEEVINALSLLNIEAATRLQKQSENKSEVPQDGTFVFKKGEMTGFLNNFKKVKRFEKGLFQKSGMPNSEVLSLFSSKKVDDISNAIKYSVRFRKYELIDKIVEVIRKNKDEHLRTQALKALAILGGKDFLTFISRGLKSRSKQVRKAAINSLKIIGSKESEAMIMTMLDDPEPEVKGAAILSLKDNKAVNIIDLIKKMVSNDDPSSREEAFYLMANISGKEIIGFLQKLRLSGKSSVSVKAQNTLDVMAGSGNLLAKAALEGIDINEFSI